jgi:hypothetical protein
VCERVGLRPDPLYCLPEVPTVSAGWDLVRPKHLRIGVGPRARRVVARIALGASGFASSTGITLDSTIPIGQTLSLCQFRIQGECPQIPIHQYEKVPTTPQLWARKQTQLVELSPNATRWRARLA